MRQIYLLWASVRSEMLYKTYKHWISTSVNKERVNVKVAVFDEAQKQMIDSYKMPNTDVIVVNDRVGYNYAMFKLTTSLEVNDEDIIICMSDDFFSPDNWDEYLDSKFQDWENAIFLDDGYQSIEPHISEKDYNLTLACMTFACLKRINKVVAHPSYVHLWSDTEAFRNLKELELLKDDRKEDNMLFKHKHYAFGFREQDQYDNRNLKYYTQDFQNYAHRYNMPVEERIRV